MKLKSQSSLVKIIKNLKSHNKKIAAISGSFDVFHTGHLYFLKWAKTKGDILIVLLNSDESIKLYKGPNRPICPQEERAGILSGLECVDYVVLFNEINPKKVLEAIKPDVYCNGSDWGKNCIEKEVVEKYGGKIAVLERNAKMPKSTNLIEKIKNLSNKKTEKAIFLDRDGVINYNNPPYLFKKEDFKFISGSINALQKLSKTYYKIFIITNQSGVGRGYFKEQDLKKLHLWMLGEMKRKKIRIDKIYYCKHGPDDGCECRKPKTGMVMRAVKEFNISLNDSWVVGDDEREVILGREVNSKTVKIGEKMKKRKDLQPNFYARNLLEAVNFILMGVFR